MSRQIDWEKPISDEDREWAMQFPIHHPLVAANDAQFKGDEESLSGTPDEGAGTSTDEVPPYEDGAYWSKSRLVDEASTRGLAIPAKATKDDLIAMLKADDDAAAADEAAKS